MKVGRVILWKVILGAFGGAARMMLGGGGIEHFGSKEGVGRRIGCSGVCRRRGE